MAEKVWHKSQYPGIRYRVHPDRRHGAGPDKYLVLAYKWDGTSYSEPIGWISKTKITEKEASFILADLQKAQRTGKGARTLKEKRELEEQARQDDKRRREEEEAERLRLEEEQRIEGITFGQVWAQYSEEVSRTKAPKTWVREAELWAGWIEPELVSMPMKKVSPFLLAKVQKKIVDAGKAPRTAFYALQVIRQVFNWAKAQDPALFTGDNPVTHTKKVKVNNKRHRFLSHDEAASLLAALKQSKKGPDTHDMALVSLHCGLRWGEIASLRWQDVNLEDGSIYIRQAVSKSGKGRTVYMTPQVNDMFLGRDQGDRDSLIFPDRYGNIKQRPSKYFDKTVEALGLNEGRTSREDRIVFHSLRHSCASWLVCSGVSLYQVQKLLGHSTHAMTERYSHLAPDNLKQTAAIMGRTVSEAQSAKVLPIERPK